MVHFGAINTSPILQCIIGSCTMEQLHELELFGLAYGGDNTISEDSALQKPAWKQINTKTIHN
jgi:hypothetical protein